MAMTLNKGTAVCLFAILLAGSAAAGAAPATAGTAYYVDVDKGDDANPGTTPDKAWKTLAKASTAPLQPGDRLLLAAGRTFPGPLRLGKAIQGTKERPVVVSSHGAGRATIDGGKGDALRLDGCAFVRVAGLDVVGCGRKEGSDGSGVVIAGTTGVEVDGVEARGFRLCGVTTGGDTGTRITNVRARDNGAAGISVNGGTTRTRDLTIRHCIAHDNPGDPKNLNNHSGNGIVVGQVTGGVIEFCEAYNNGWDMPRKGNGPVGIWGWECNTLVIQHCVSHDNKTQQGAYDGGGFDFDGGMTDSVLQYNLSFNNHGAGYLLCQYPGASPWKGNVCRYNISVNDALTNHEAGIHFWDGQKDISDARIHNNLVVNARHGVKSTGDVAGLVFSNNIFICDGDAIVGPLKRARFEGNLYWPRKGGALFRDGGQAFKTLEEWAKATGQESAAGKLLGLVGDPKVSLPATPDLWPKDPAKLAATPFGRLLPGSPCLGAGAAVPDPGGRDFFGTALPAGRRPSIGVHEPGR
jgi:hypothetical protein